MPAGTLPDRGVTDPAVVPPALRHWTDQPSTLIAEAVAVQCKRGTVPLLPTLRFGKWVMLRYFGATARQASRRAWWRAVAALRTVRATGDVA